MIRFVGGLIMMLTVFCLAKLLDDRDFAHIVSLMQITVFGAAIASLGLVPQHARASVLARAAGNVRSYRQAVLKDVLRLVAIGAMLATFLLLAPIEWPASFAWIPAWAVCVCAFMHGILLILSSSLRGLGKLVFSETSQFIGWRVLFLVAIIFLLSTQFVVDLSAIVTLLVSAYAIATVYTIAVFVLVSRRLDVPKTAESSVGAEHALPARASVPGVITQIAINSVGLAEAVATIHFMTPTAAAIFLMGTRLAQWQMFLHKALDAVLINKLVRIPVQRGARTNETSGNGYRGGYVAVFAMTMIGTLSLIFLATATGFVPSSYGDSVIVYLTIAAGMFVLSLTGKRQQELLVNLKFGYLLSAWMVWHVVFWGGLASIVLLKGGPSTLELGVVEGLAFAGFSMMIHHCHGRFGKLA